MFILPVAIEGRIHPIPFRTRKLSSPSPMILPVGGKVGRCGLFFAHFIRPYSGRIFFCLNGIPCGGRAGFKTYSVVEGSRRRPDAFFGKYVDFGVRRVPGAFSRVWEGVRFSAFFSPAGDGRHGEIPCGGRAGFKTGPYSVVEGSRRRPDAFFGKYVDFGVRRVLGAFSRVWEGVRFSALSPRPSRSGIPRPGPRPR